MLLTDVLNYLLCNIPMVPKMFSVLMTCLPLFVRCAEINQWPLDFITRIHVHMRDRKTHRHEDTKRDNKKD